MVDQKGDIPERDEVEPNAHGIFNVLRELLDDHGTEVIVHFEDGSTEELHSHDTYIWPTFEVVYTQSNDNDVWFGSEDVVKVERHYE